MLSRRMSLLLAGLVSLLPSPAAHASSSGAMMRAINGWRRAHGRAALHPSHRLSHLARRSSDAVADRRRFAHPFRPSPGHGEILEYHTGSLARVRLAVRLWAHSPEHRHLMLSRRFHRVGAGDARGRIGGRRVVVWAVELGG